MLKCKDNMRIFIATLLPVIAVSLSCWYFSTNDTNHTGMEFLLWIIPLIVCVIILVRRIKYNNMAKIGVILNLLAIMFFYAVDSSNYMVQYDKWLKRGQPEKYKPFWQN